MHRPARVRHQEGEVDLGRLDRAELDHRLHRSFGETKHDGFVGDRFRSVRRVEAIRKCFGESRCAFELLLVFQLVRMLSDDRAKCDDRIRAIAGALTTWLIPQKEQ